MVKERKKIQKVSVTNGEGRSMSTVKTTLSKREYCEVLCYALPTERFYSCVSNLDKKIKINIDKKLRDSTLDIDIERFLANPLTLIKLYAYFKDVRIVCEVPDSVMNNLELLSIFKSRELLCETIVELWLRGETDGADKLYRILFKDSTYLDGYNYRLLRSPTEKVLGIILGDLNPVESPSIDKVTGALKAFNTTRGSNLKLPEKEDDVWHLVYGIKGMLDDSSKSKPFLDYLIEDLAKSEVEIVRLMLEDASRLKSMSMLDSVLNLMEVRETYRCTRSSFLLMCANSLFLDVLVKRDFNNDMLVMNLGMDMAEYLQSLSTNTSACSYFKTAVSLLSSVLIGNSFKHEAFSQVTRLKDGFTFGGSGVLHALQLVCCIQIEGHESTELLLRKIIDSPKDESFDVISTFLMRLRNASLVEVIGNNEFCAGLCEGILKGYSRYASEFGLDLMLVDWKDKSKLTYSNITTVKSTGTELLMQKYGVTSPNWECVEESTDVEQESHKVELLNSEDILVSFRQTVDRIYKLGIRLDKLKVKEGKIARTVDETGIRIGKLVFDVASVDVCTDFKKFKQDVGEVRKDIKKSYDEAKSKN